MYIKLPTTTIPPIVPPAIASLEELPLPELDGRVVALVVALVVEELVVELVVGLVASVVAKAEASRVNPPVMMLTPVMLQHEGGGVSVKLSQQKVPAEVEHCDSSGVFPTLEILRQNCGHDGDDQF